jgi:transcriptional regulator with XRE-family HTH domain
LALPNENDKSLGAELKRRRLALKWTQQETASHFEVLKDSYQNWEWNKYIPHIRNRKKVIEFLGYNYWDDGTDSLSNRCLLYRVEYGLTMSEFASRMNVSTRSIERIEDMGKNVSSEMEEVVNSFLCLR